MEKLINDFSFGLFVWQTLLFLILLYLLYRFAWKPILNAINDREEGIKNALAAAEEAKKEMQNGTADSEKLVQDAREQAKLEGDKLIAQAKASIDSEKKAAVAEIKTQVADLSVQIAEKILKEQLANKDKQLKLVDDLLGDIKLK